MPAASASAPGKIILFGEHAVVYGRPALAAPLSGVRATATINDGESGAGLHISAPDVGVRLTLAETAAHGLTMMAGLVLNTLRVPEPDAKVEVRSEIPIAAGLGSGAAVTAALGRALGTYLGHTFGNEPLSALVYEVEKYYHGTPSGIDNTVICYEQPVYFVRGERPQVFTFGGQFDLLVGDTGIASPTKTTVGMVRERWQAEPEAYEKLFDAVAEVVVKARRALETGDPKHTGELMSRNHELLQEIGVSSHELDRLVEVALSAGATGAKLSGGGGGGNMIALVLSNRIDDVRESLLSAGAAKVLHTTINQDNPSC